MSNGKCGQSKEREGVSPQRDMAGEWLIRVQGLRGGAVQGHNKIPVWLHECCLSGADVKVEGAKKMKKLSGKGA